MIPSAAERAEYRAKKKAALEFKPGVIYEDCAYHPCLCIEADYENDYMRGISLIDGTIRGCSIFNCGPWVMTVEQALHTKENWATIQADVAKQMAEWNNT